MTRYFHHEAANYLRAGLTLLLCFAYSQDDPQDLCEIDSTKSLGNGSVGFVWTPRDGKLSATYFSPLYYVLSCIFRPKLPSVCIVVVPDSDEEEEEEDEGVMDGAAQHNIDPLRMGSIGCTADERWKR